MKDFTLLVALLCGSYNMQAQAYIATADSSTKINCTIQQTALDLPFIGLVSLEGLPYAFQQITLPFQIPILSKDSSYFNFPEVDTLVSTHYLQAPPKTILVEVDSLDVDG